MTGAADDFQERIDEAFFGDEYRERTTANELAGLLDDVHAFLGRFVAYPSDHAHVAHTLWAAHAHAVDAFTTTPRLAFLSPEPESGKTRALEILELLTPNPLLALNVNPAPLFRLIESERPTLLLDEVDAIFTQRGKDDTNEDLRALLNSGYRRGATIPRCHGPKHDVKRFPVYAAVALAGLGDLPDTLMTRAVIIRMRPRAPAEHIDDFDYDFHAKTGHDLRDRLAACLDGIKLDYPDIPQGVTDRARECWRPLLAIAEAAGDHWPDRGRAACAELVKVTRNREASLGIKLLTDLRMVFGSKDAMHTVDILKALRDLDESPWDDLRGKPLAARGLARMLRRYEVTSTKVKIAKVSLQGYRREHLWPVWERYLSSVSAQPEPPEPPEPPRSEDLFGVPDADRVPDGNGTPDPNGTQETTSDLHGSTGSTGSAYAGTESADPTGDSACVRCGKFSTQHNDGQVLHDICHRMHQREASA